jgi:hypothetical protein
MGGDDRDAPGRGESRPPGFRRRATRRLDASRRHRNRGDASPNTGRAASRSDTRVHSNNCSEDPTATTSNRPRTPAMTRASMPERAQAHISTSNRSFRCRSISFERTRDLPLRGTGGETGEFRLNGPGPGRSVPTKLNDFVAFAEDSGTQTIAYVLARIGRFRARPRRSQGAPASSPSCRAASSTTSERFAHRHRDQRPRPTGPLA